MTDKVVLTFQRRVREYIRRWKSQGYEVDIPDFADENLEALGKVPTYRRICLAILSNDWHMQTLGYRAPLCQAYMDLKHIEIEARHERLRRNTEAAQTDI